MSESDRELRSSIEAMWASRFELWQHGRRVSQSLFAFRCWLGLREARIHVQDEIADLVMRESR